VWFGGLEQAIDSLPSIRSDVRSFRPSVPPNAQSGNSSSGAGDASTASTSSCSTILSKSFMCVMERAVRCGNWRTWCDIAPAPDGSFEHVDRAARSALLPSLIMDDPFPSVFLRQGARSEGDTAGKAVK